jgi:hypothetical protein
LNVEDQAKDQVKDQVTDQVKEQVKEHVDYMFNKQLWVQGAGAERGQNSSKF